MNTTHEDDPIYKEIWTTVMRERTEEWQERSKYWIEECRVLERDIFMPHSTTREHSLVKKAKLMAGIYAYIFELVFEVVFRYSATKKI